MSELLRFTNLKRLSGDLWMEAFIFKTIKRVSKWEHGRGILMTTNDVSSVYSGEKSPELFQDRMEFIRKIQKLLCWIDLDYVEN